MIPLPPEIESLPRDELRNLLDAVLESCGTKFRMEQYQEQFRKEPTISIPWEQLWNIFQLSFEEKMVVADMITERLEAFPFEMTPELSALLAGRLADYRANPEDTVSSEEVFAGLKEKS
jgi:putative addiction module component (TIGR02574 family)